MRKARICYFLFANWLAFTSQAENSTGEPSQDILFELSISELLNLNVSVATAKEETVSSAPAIVSRYSIDRLKAMGLRSIDDVLAFIPGFFTDKVNSDFPTLSVRGTSTFSSANVLVMIDGVPAFSPTHHKPILLGIPFDGIEHIEVIRGPGAVIYGTAAMSGVINFITKQQMQMSATAQIGDNNKRRFSASWGSDIATDTQMYIHLDKQLDDGFAGTVESPSSRTNDLFLHTQKDFSSALLRLNHSDWAILTHYFSDASNGHQNSIDLPILQEQKSDGYLLHGERYFNWDDNRITLYADWQKKDQGFFGETVSFIPNNQHQDRRVRFGGNWRFSISDTSELFFGTEFEERRTGGQNVVNPNTLDIIRPSFSKQKINEWAAFAQWDKQWQDWRVLIGARFIEHSTAGSSVKPRFSLVYNLSPHSSLKALYAEGYTQPTFVQLFLDARPNVLGDETLREEHITSYDLAYNYVSANTNFTASLFYFEGEDLIRVGPAPIELDANTAWTNEPTFNRHGAELDYQWVDERFTLMANVAYLREGNQQDDNDMRARLAPRYTGNLGVSYRFKRHVLGSNIHFRSARENSRVASNTRWDINYEYYWAENSYVYVTARNILERAQISPDVSTDFGFLFPRDHQDLNWLAGVDLRF